MAAALARAQTPLEFDAASVRVAKVMPADVRLPMVGDIAGGPGTEDPGRLTCTWVRPERLLMEAFGLPLDQIVAPDWGNTVRYNVIAAVPAGATKEQAREMLLNLLRERFHLAYHHEKRDFDAYTLVVAKGGPRLQDAAHADDPLPEAVRPASRGAAAGVDGDGFPILPAGLPAARGEARNGVMRMTFRMSPPGVLLRLLGPTVKAEDKTGLTGKYDFHLEYSPAGLPGLGGRGTAVPDPSADPAPDLFTALEKQLGLKLEKGKTQLDVVVIDRMDKEPSAN